MEQMIAHHEGAIAVAEDETSDGRYQPAVDLAASSPLEGGVMRAGAADAGPDRALRLRARPRPRQSRPAAA